MSATIPRVLIIAGSDSGGGAGIQADLKTVTALGAFGMTAITALTAQNTTGVHAVLEIEPDFVGRQIEVCAEDIGCDAVKIGMLANAGIVEAVANVLRRLRLGPIVLDPVLRASSGAPLLAPEGVAALVNRLLPLAEVVTPNLAEAALLAGQAVDSPEPMRAAARRIHALGPAHVVVKGGHLPHEPADLLFDGREFFEFSGPRFPSRHTHGTGCIFASAVAAGLASGRTVRESVRLAKDFVTAAIRRGLPIGQGQGPANPAVAAGIALAGFLR
jgi:hydroxymethylpyrimidine/phosphomethylpyrimidine kinase